ncbi:MAG: hypothetical protein EXQ49_10925 [Acidobacteria bacterium]|nr:hypothetical protein [Acidobacteriota bacterium]
MQEAQAASALNQPNIITIHDVITEGDSDIMVMEMVAGKTLDAIIPRGGLRYRRSSTTAHRWPTRLPLRMARASSTATSSPATSWSPNATW